MHVLTVRASQTLDQCSAEIHNIVMVMVDLGIWGAGTKLFLCNRKYLDHGYFFLFCPNLLFVGYKLKIESHQKT